MAFTSSRVDGEDVVAGRLRRLARLFSPAAIASLPLYGVGVWPDVVPFLQMICVLRGDKEMFGLSWVLPQGGISCRR